MKKVQSESRHYCLFFLAHSREERHHLSKNAYPKIRYPAFTFRSSAACWLTVREPLNVKSCGKRISVRSRLTNPGVVIDEYEAAINGQVTKVPDSKEYLTNIDMNAHQSTRLAILRNRMPSSSAGNEARRVLFQDQFVTIWPFARYLTVNGTQQPCRSEAAAIRRIQEIMPPSTSPLTLQSTHMETPEAQSLSGFDRRPAAFGELYRSYLNPVYRYLLARVGSPADAEDLTSQVFLAALEGLPRYQPQGPFAAWLFSIARHKTADHFRRRSAEAPLSPESDPPAPESDLLAQVIHQENLRHLSQQVARLPEEEQELLRLRFAARLSFDEMAVVLGRKTSAVKMSYYRLLERLETELEIHHE